MKVLTRKLDEFRGNLVVLQPAQQRSCLGTLPGSIKTFDNNESTAFWHVGKTEDEMEVKVKREHASSDKRAGMAYHHAATCLLHKPILHLVHYIYSHTRNMARKQESRFKGYTGKGVSTDQYIDVS